MVSGLFGLLFDHASRADKRRPSIEAALERRVRNSLSARLACWTLHALVCVRLRRVPQKMQSTLLSRALHITHHH